MGDVTDSNDHVPTRTIAFEYTGTAQASDVFDELEAIFAAYGLKVESCSDGPTEDHERVTAELWQEALARAAEYDGSHG